MGARVMPAREGVRARARNPRERQACKKLPEPSKEGEDAAQEGAPQNQGDVQTRREGAQLQGGGGEGQQSRVGAGHVQTRGRSDRCHMPGDASRVDRGGMCKPIPGSVQSWERAKLGHQAPTWRRGAEVGVGSANHLGGLASPGGCWQIPKDLAGRGRVSVERPGSRPVPGSGHANPGRDGRGGQGGPCRERVGGIAGGLALAQAGAGGPQAWDTCPVGVLTSRAQHLEQLEVLDAHLLLVPCQVGCGHRRRMSPAGA